MIYRLATWKAGLFVTGWAFCVGLPAWAQSNSDSPSLGLAFRSRTDRFAAEDTLEIRRRIENAYDSRGLINPLADYSSASKEARSKAKANKNALNGRNATGPRSMEDDEEANRRPTLSAEQQANLRNNPPSVLASDLPTVGWFPPPQRIVAGSLAANDDGFRPSRLVSSLPSTGNVTPSSYPTPTGYTNSWNNGTAWPTAVTSYYQIDQEAILPPTLSYPPTGGNTGLPPASYGAPMQNGPGIPMQSGPGIGSPMVGGPVGNPNYGQPSGGFASTPNSLVVPGTVMPAPPPVMINPGMGRSMPAGSPNDIMPSYPRAPGLVNGPPFVSNPPCQFDAYNMVSPSVYRQSVDGCGPAPRTAQPMMGQPMAGQPMVGQPTGSPFAYAPPTSMPPPSAYAPQSGGHQHRPLIGFGQGANAQLGRGIVGQPTAYVNGQPIRNFLRYIFP
jgi:hypothetical protein